MNNETETIRVGTPKCVHRRGSNNAISVLFMFYFIIQTLATAPTHCVTLACFIFNEIQGCGKWATTSYSWFHLHYGTLLLVVVYCLTDAYVLRVLGYSRCGHAFASTAVTTMVTTTKAMSSEAVRLPADCEVSSSSVQKSPADVPVQVQPKSVHIPAPPHTIPSNWQNTAVHHAAGKADNTQR